MNSGAGPQLGGLLVSGLSGRQHQLGPSSPNLGGTGTEPGCGKTWAVEPNAVSLPGGDGLEAVMSVVRGTRCWVPCTR